MPLARTTRGASQALGALGLSVRAVASRLALVFSKDVACERTGERVMGARLIGVVDAVTIALLWVGLVHAPSCRRASANKAGSGLSTGRDAFTAPVNLAAA